jgi:hypothetical protein
MFEPVKIMLKRPVKHGDEEIRELVFGREMVVGGSPPTGGKE